MEPYSLLTNNLKSRIFFLVEFLHSAILKGIIVTIIFTDEKSGWQTYPTKSLPTSHFRQVISDKSPSDNAFSDKIISD
ncbi:hypothetical protein BpHYR1_039654, partial [Brachionus plicatilis]